MKNKFNWKNYVFSASSFSESIENDIPLISMINILFEFINIELILLLILIFLIILYYQKWALYFPWHYS